MIWRDHVFNFGPKSGNEGDKISRKKTGEALAETVFFLILSPSEPILRANIEYMISPDYVLCYTPWAMVIPGKKWKFWNLLVRRRQPLWCQWRPLCGFGNFEKKIQNFGFFLQILKIMEKFEKLRILISKVGGKLWRREGYMSQKYVT